MLQFLGLVPSDSRTQAKYRKSRHATSKLREGRFFCTSQTPKVPTDAMNESYRKLCNKEAELSRRERDVVEREMRLASLHVSQAPQTLPVACGAQRPYGASNVSRTVSGPARVNGFRQYSRQNPVVSRRMEPQPVLMSQVSADGPFPVTTSCYGGLPASGMPVGVLRGRQPQSSLHYVTGPTSPVMQPPELSVPPRRPPRQVSHPSTPRTSWLLQPGLPSVPDQPGVTAPAPPISCPSSGSHRPPPPQNLSGGTAISMGVKDVNVGTIEGLSADPEVKMIQERLIQKHLGAMKQMATSSMGETREINARKEIKVDVPQQIELRSLEEELIKLQQQKLQYQINNKRVENAKKASEAPPTFDVFEEGLAVDADANDPNVHFGFGGQPVLVASEAETLPIVGFSVKGGPAFSVFSGVKEDAIPNNSDYVAAGFNFQVEAQRQRLLQQESGEKLAIPSVEEQSMQLHELKQMLSAKYGLPTQPTAGETALRQQIANEMVSQRMKQRQQMRHVDVRGQAPDGQEPPRGRQEAKAVPVKAEEQVAGDSSMAATQVNTSICPSSEAKRALSKGNGSPSAGTAAVSDAETAVTPSDKFLSDGYEDIIAKYTVANPPKAKMDHVTTFVINNVPTGVAEIDGSQSTVEEREIHVFMVLEDPMVMIYKNFITDVEIQAILHLAEGRWEPCKTSKGALKGDANSYESQISKSRTSWTVRFTDLRHPLIMRLEKRAATIVGVDVRHVEPCCILRYRPGEFFKVHHDGDFRLCTLVVYLNDVAEGGNTEFSCLDLSIPPQKGCAMRFANVDSSGDADMRTLHAGLPPTKGTKYVIPIFINREPVNYSHDDQPGPILVDGGH